MAIKTSDAGITNHSTKQNPIEFLKAIIYFDVIQNAPFQHHPKEETRILILIVSQILAAQRNFEMELCPFSMQAQGCQMNHHLKYCGLDEMRKATTTATIHSSSR
jgi:hypothetical protein